MRISVISDLHLDFADLVLPGGDDFIRGVVSMAESMSSVTCEECGNLGERSSGGWIRTLCKTHREQRE